MRARLCIYPVSFNSRMPASTIGKPVFPSHHSLKCSSSPHNSLLWADKRVVPCLAKKSRSSEYFLNLDMSAKVFKHSCLPPLACSNLKSQIVNGVKTVYGSFVLGFNVVSGAFSNKSSKLLNSIRFSKHTFSIILSRSMLNCTLENEASQC
uniref:Uncharacterized protein n=1 Tax=Romanomermis culicivorax TaxID=13658 RepID=A0A915JW98_ROMCU